MSPRNHGLAFFGHIPDLIIIQSACFRVDIVRNGMIILSGNIGRTSVGQMSAIGQAHSDLGNYSEFAVYSAQKGSRLFAYKRGSYVCAVNPGAKTQQLKLEGKYEIVYAFGGSSLSGASVTMPSQSFVVLKPAE